MDWRNGSRRNSLSPLMIPVLGFAALAAAAHPADADVVIAKYTFNSGSVASSDTEPNSTASAMATGPGTDSNWSFSTSTNMAFARSSHTDSTEADAISNDRYFTFTITPSAGYQLNLNSLSIDLGGSTGTGHTLNASFALRTGVDSFGSDLLNQTVTVSTTGGAASLTTFNISLPVSLQGVTGPVEFRLYVWDDTETDGEIDRFDNAIVNGTVTATAVPTPAAAPAGLALLGGLLGFRRRR